MGKKGPVLELEQDSPLLCLPGFHVGMVVVKIFDHKGEILPLAGQVFPIASLRLGPGAAAVFTAVTSLVTAYPLPCLKSRKCHGGPCCPHCGCAHHGSHAAT